MKLTRRVFPLFILLCLLPAAVHALLGRAPEPASPEGLPSYAEPGISPDGREIAFVSGGDIWTVPASGGEARLLISHPANESRPLYSPDGKLLAFASTRTGNGDVYVLTFATGEVKRLTFDDAFELPNAWSRDSKWIYFSTTGHDISGMNDVYRVSVEGGTPMPVAADRYANEFFGAPSPDGQTLAISARGTASGQWWRRGHSHLDESEITLVHDANPPSYERIVEDGAKNLWPMWSADGKSVYFMSDRSGAENIWVKPLGGAARQVTHFRDGRVLWPSISADGRTIAFERNFGIWKLDVGSGQAAEVAITRRGAPASPSVEHLSLSNQFQELALSPDGKKVAFVVRGEVFAASAKDGGEAMRVTHTTAAESEVAWAPDSRRIVYVSEREPTPHLFLYDFGANTEVQLTRDAQDDCTPRFSPDGKLVLFKRGGRELRLLDIEAKQERVLATGAFSRPPLNEDRPYVFSADGKWVAYLGNSTKGFEDIFLVQVAGGTPQQVSFLANAFSDNVAWSSDGTFLLYTTSQRTEPGQIARIDLIPRAPKFREDQFRDLFREPPRAPAKEAAPAPAAQAKAPAKEETKKPETKPVEIVFDEIRRRLSLVPVGVDVNSVEVSPDGKLLLFSASTAGQNNLYVYSVDELATEPPVTRQITSTPGGKGAAQFTPDSKEVYFLQQGRINIVNVESRQVRPLSVSAEMDVDFPEMKMAAFTQAWRYLRDSFYDPNFHGVNWDAVRATYEPRIAASSTPDEMRRLLSLMVGELNSSHSGVSGPFGGGGNVAGRLGLAFDRAEYEQHGRLRITDIIPLGPAALAKDAHVGEYLLAVDGAAIGPHVNLDELLEHKINRRIALTLSASADGAGKREVAVRPISMGAEKNLLYRRWVDERRAYVEKASNGRLGYAHMPDMGAGSLAQLYVDLDTANQAREGVVIDIRNNNGGFVNVYAIDVLARRPYLTMTPRGFPSVPARSQLGQRALELPTILVINQHSLSDAEDFTEGYRALGLGKVVGEPTAGWIIYTSGAALVDGSVIRLPFIRITDHEGKLMELHPRPVDIPLQRPVGESYSGKDAQLDAAVRELLKEIESRPRR